MTSPVTGTIPPGNFEVYGLLAAGLAANRPVAGIMDRWYFSTDTLIMEYDIGVAWVESLRGEAAIRLAQLAERAHGSLTGIGAADHHARYTDAEATAVANALIAIHTALVAAHHARYTDAETDARVAIHAAIVAAHHARYTDAEAAAQAAILIAVHAALPTVHQDAPALIGVHTAIVAAHHARYTDGEADARIAIHATFPNIHHAPCTEGARVYHNANQAIPNLVPTMVAFNSQRYDTDLIHDTVVNNSRLTCRTPGYYDITFNGSWAANVVGRRSANFRLNGVTLIAATTPPTDPGGYSQPLVETKYYLSLGDFVEIELYQTSGGALNMDSIANYSPEFSMHRNLP